VHAEECCVSCYLDRVLLCATRGVAAITRQAQRWRERLSLPREPGWDRVLSGLARPSVSDGKYLFAESAPDSYGESRWRRDHPAVTAAYGLLPGPGADPETMRRSLDWILANWNWSDTWGWDYPMLAMSAAGRDPVLASRACDSHPPCCWPS
jgi:hypothetical protein